MWNNNGFGGGCWWKSHGGRVAKKLLPEGQLVQRGAVQYDMRHAWNLLKWTGRVYLRCDCPGVPPGQGVRRPGACPVLGCAFAMSAAGLAAAAAAAIVAAVAVAPTIAVVVAAAIVIAAAVATTIAAAASCGPMWPIFPITRWICRSMEAKIPWPSG